MCVYESLDRINNTQVIFRYYPFHDSQETRPMLELDAKQEARFKDKIKCKDMVEVFWQNRLVPQNNITLYDVPRARMIGIYHAA